MPRVAYRASVVTMKPATMSVRLNVIADRSFVIPSAERLSLHQYGSLAVSIAASTPSMRNTARIRASSDRSICVAE